MTESQYTFLGLQNNCWTIIEHGRYELDYECEFESFDEAQRFVIWLRWIEEIYSPSRQ